LQILLVSNGFPPSGQWGTEFYTHQLASGLVERGHEVTVLCPLRDGSRSRYTVERSWRYGIRLIEVHNAGAPGKPFADSYVDEHIDGLFSKLLEELQPDLVHFNHLLWGLSVGLPAIARARGVPTVATLTDYGLLCHRGQFFDWRLERCGGPRRAADCARCIREPSRYDANLVLRTAKRLAVRGMAAMGGIGPVVTTQDLVEREATVRGALASIDHFVAPTERMAEVFRSAGVPPDRITTLCYGVDEAPFREAVTTTRPDRVRIGFLGQFLPHKGLHVLFDAVRCMQSRLPESLEPWEVVVHGNGVQGRHHLYLETIWSEDLAERVCLAGPFEPLSAPRVMAGLDAVVVPSVWDENAPLTVLQARASGVAVVASRVSGMTEVVEEGSHGWLVEPGDPVALADALRAVILERPARDPDLVPPPVSYAEHMRRILGIYRDLSPAASAAPSFHEPVRLGTTAS